MARIPETELERVKRDISLQRLAESRGIALKKHGADLIGLCPFHDDHEPSLVITPSKNLWHCLGACQTGGSVIDWVMKAEGVSFRHAVELLLSDYQPTTTQQTVKKATIKKLPTALELDADDQQLLMQVVDYYHQSLKHTPDALAYAEKRGITLEAIEHFKLGFADRTLGYRLPEKNRAAGAAIRGRLQRLGLLRTSGHEHFRGSLVIPVINNNQVLEIYGRKITNKVRAGTPLHLYLPGPHKGVFNLDALKSSKEIILCESLIDALTFWCAGFRNVTASYGIEGFTDEHLNAFKEHKTERVLIAYDRDEAGEKAASSLAAKLMKEGIDGYRLQFPKGMDANEYALSVQPASKSLSVVIRGAVWLGDVQGSTSVAGGTTPGMEEVEQRMEQLPRKPGATKGEPPSKPAAIATEIETLKSKNNKAESNDKTVLPLAAPARPEGSALGVHPAPAALAHPCASAAELENLATSLEPNDEPFPASVIPATPKADIEAQINGDEIILLLGNRRYRIRGLYKNTGVNPLKINVLISSGDELHMDTFDIAAHKGRAGFVRQAAIELGLKEEVIRHDLSKMLLKLETLQETHLKNEQQSNDKTIILNDAEQSSALDLLKAPDLLDRILHDFERCGVVGEQNNKLIGYLAAVSRKLDKPLAVMVQSSSAAGKSSLMDAVLAMMPSEDKVQYSAMTGQSLYYIENGDLSHKILAIAEEEGAHQASYALKLLQSEGELSIASTSKDPETGKHVTHPYTVKGPVMIFTTTTAIDLDEELMNRCLVLSVDESREQTRAIHEQQRLSRTLEGLKAKKQRQTILGVHKNAQRLLKPLSVMNPYSPQLTFLDDRTRLRRDHEKYLTLIDVIALLHQYQRPAKQVNHDGEIINYVEVTLDDIAVANKLAHAMLGRSLDELPPQTRKLLNIINQWVDGQCTELDMEHRDFRFSRRDVREVSTWGNTQLKIHLHRLEEMEYLLVHRGGRGQSIVYELLYDGQGQEGEPFMTGLIDVEQLKYDYDEKKSGVKVNKSGPSRPQVGGVSVPGRGSKNNDNDCINNDLTEKDRQSSENAVISKNNNTALDHNRSHSPVSLAAKG